MVHGEEELTEITEKTWMEAKDPGVNENSLIFSILPIP